MLGECLVFRLKPNQGYLHPGWLGTRLHAKRAENPGIGGHIPDPGIGGVVPDPGIGGTPVCSSRLPPIDPEPA